MQTLASELNLSATAFLYSQDEIFHLRWFTPKVEVDFCGHATLASAHILYETGRPSKNRQARFETRSGLFSARFQKGMIELDFPAPQDDSGKYDFISRCFAPAVEGELWVEPSGDRVLLRGEAVTVMECSLRYDS